MTDSLTNSYGNLSGPSMIVQSAGTRWRVAAGGPGPERPSVAEPDGGATLTTDERIEDGPSTKGGVSGDLHGAARLDSSWPSTDARLLDGGPSRGRWGAVTLDSFCLEDVRCFTGAQKVRIRPLTFLVGENSTGKSTILGCMQAVADYMEGMGPEIDFNQHPYEMGSFREIVRKSRPLLESFKLGAAFRGRDGQEAARYTVELGEREGGARADVKQVTWRVWDLRIVLRPSRELSRRDGPRIRVVAEDDLSFMLEVSHLWLNRNHARPWMWRWFGLRDADATSFDLLQVALAERLGGRKHVALYGLFPATSIAPIRSKPQRTYNPFADAPDAEGSEVPAELARLARKGGAKWDRLKVQLEQFGREAGLFSELVVRKLGQSGSDPFQLQVKARGPRANIKDVGYGVSQVLPILARLAHPSGRAATTLVQQPEVHLHPRGQAALSSILISLLGWDGKRRRRSLHFVIETHSDYMIDRARIAVRRGQIKADDVSLVYLEPKSRGGVTVHNLRFDKNGNMIGAPSGYRDFFLKEADALLGFGEQ